MKSKLLLIAVLSAFTFSLNACHKTSDTTLAQRYETGALQWQIVRKEIDPNTLIHQAILENEPEVIKFLISHGINVDYPNENGMTPLTMAIVNKSTDAVKLLLTNGANPNPGVKWNNMSLLELAIIMKDPVSTKLLVEHNAGVNEKFKGTLASVINSKWTEIARLMIDKGADLSSDDTSGPFGVVISHAISQNDTTFLKLFLQKGADINVVFKHRGQPYRIPLIEAVSHGNLSMVKLFVELGADINKSIPNNSIPRRTETRTPLNQAVDGGNVEIIQYLLQQGARS